MFDVFGDRINENDIYFITPAGRVLIKNLKKHVLNKFGIELFFDSEEQLIEYADKTLFYDAIVYKRENYFNKLF